MVQHDKTWRNQIARFQRHKAWDRYPIRSLIKTIVHNLPLGITLVLEVGDQEKFISRFLQTSPENGRNRALNTFTPTWQEDARIDQYQILLAASVQTYRQNDEYTSRKRL